MLVLAALLLVGVAAALLFNAIKPDATSAPDKLRSDDRRLLAMGETLYAQHCAACHGVQLQGQANWRERDAQGRLPAPPHDASGHTWHHADEVLFRITKLGVAEAAGLANYESNMPAYAKVLSDEEIVATLSWIKSTWPADVRSKHDEINAFARAKR